MLKDGPSKQKGLDQKLIPVHWHFTKLLPQNILGLIIRPISLVIKTTDKKKSKISVLFQGCTGGVLCLFMCVFVQILTSEAESCKLLHESTVPKAQKKMLLNLKFICEHHLKIFMSSIFTEVWARACGKMVKYAYSFAASIIYSSFKRNFNWKWITDSEMLKLPLSDFNCQVDSESFLKRKRNTTKPQSTRQYGIGTKTEI